LFFQLGDLPFSVDESHWIGLSDPFEAFIEGRFNDSLWQTRPGHHINGMVTFYVIGATRRLAGWQTSMLNQPYDFEKPLADNEAEGRVPSPGLLWWGRAGVTLCAAAALFAFWLLLRRAADPWVAGAWLALALANPYLRVMLRRAGNEGLLIGALALVMFASERMLAALDHAPAVRSRGAWLGWLGVSGAAVGVAAQVKLNGGSAVAGVAVLAVASLLRQPSTERDRRRALGAAAIVLSLSAALTFVALDPTLWPSPARHVSSAVRSRGRLIRSQVDRYPVYAVSSFAERVHLVPARVLDSYALVRPALLNAVLSGAGLAVAVVAFRRWLRGEHRNHALAVLLIVGASVAIPPLFTPLDWDRYYLLPAFFSGPSVVLGGLTLIRRLRAHVRREKTTGAPESAPARPSDTPIVRLRPRCRP
jgi:hypothetical protein